MMDHGISGISLFTACDAPPGVMSIESFNENLIYSLLFSNGVVLHEAYFFNSRLLSQHVSSYKDRRSLFAAAAANGLVYPAFRKPEISSLSEAFEFLQEVYGHSPGLFPAQQTVEHRKIIDSVDSSLIDKIIQPIYWPQPGSKDGQTVGEGFEDALRAWLQTEKPPLVNGDSEDRKSLLNRVWAASSDWRTKCIEEAAETTRKNNGLGIARNYLLLAIAESLGLNPDNRFYSSNDLLSVTSGERRLALGIILRCIDELHWRNFAGKIGVGACFAQYDLSADLTSGEMSRIGMGGRSSGIIIPCDVELPDIEVIMNAPADEILMLRRYYGADYLEELKRAAVGNIRESELRSKFQAYCKQLSRFAKDSEPEKKTAYFLQPDSRSGSAWQIINSSLAAASGLYCSFEPGVAESTVAAGGAIAGFLAVIPIIKKEFERTKAKRIRSAKPSIVDLNIDRKSVIVHRGVA